MFRNKKTKNQKISGIVKLSDGTYKVPLNICCPKCGGIAYFNSIFQVYTCREFCGFEQKASKYIELNKEN